MSWNFSLKVPRNEAGAAFAQTIREQPAYQTDGAHRDVMDEIMMFASEIAMLAPEGSDVVLTSSGHVNSDGQGNCSVALDFHKPYVPPPAAAA